MRKLRAVFIFLLCVAALSVTNAEVRNFRLGGQSAHAQTNQAVDFDYYLLSLSWSPTYCLSHPKDVAQCGSKGLAFVLHGLWPQYAAGGYPQDCATEKQLTQDARDLGATVFPSPKLIDHEWSKHGTCSGLSASDYFKDADQARMSIKVPDQFVAPAGTQSMTASAIVDAFTAANPGMPASALVVECNGSKLSEVHFCMDKDLSLMECGAGNGSNCGTRPIRIPAVH